MAIRSVSKNVLAWVICNLELLCIKTVGLLVRIAPYKVSLIETLGLFTGFVFLCLKFNRWREITKFARHTGSTLPVPLYLGCYWVQRGRDRVWEEAYHEATFSLKQYITTENEEMIEKAVGEGKGAILLGAHIGPKLCSTILHEMNIDVKTLVGHSGFERQQNILKLGIEFLLSKDILFFKDTQRALLTRDSEKELVRHLRKGGVISMFIDFHARQGVIAEFFGLPFRFSVFPFKLALRHNSPVFFYFLDKAQNGGYRLCFVPSGDFLTPEEGVKRYASFFQAQITKYPFMWAVPSFLNWDPRDADQHHTSKLDQVNV
ncbi:MAG TPA: lysophospholipid acyltransferase family protein [Candidatus Hypogeohydataceae bacterium YC41]